MHKATRNILSQSLSAQFSIFWTLQVVATEHAKMTSSQKLAVGSQNTAKFKIWSSVFDVKSYALPRGFCLFSTRKSSSWSKWQPKCRKSSKIRVSRSRNGYSTAINLGSRDFWDPKLSQCVIWTRFPNQKQSFKGGFLYRKKVFIWHKVESWAIFGPETVM